MPVLSQPKTIEKAEPIAKPKPFTVGLSASMFVWLLLIFFAVDLTARMLSPHKIENTTAYSQKLETFFKSNMHPDLVLLGSSVALSSSFESDSAIGAITSKKRKDNYLGALHLSHSIEATTGKKFASVNLACFGAMTDYTPTCVSKMVEFKKIPKVIVFETVSRDLFDASMPRSFESPYNRSMAYLHPQNSTTPVPIQKAIDWFMGTRLMVFLSASLTDGEMMLNPERLRFEFDSMIGDLVYVYSQRLEISRQLTDAVSRLLNRQNSLYSSVLQTEIENKRKNPFAPVLQKPVATYQVDPTPQLGRFEDEKVYFIKLLQLCRRHKIQLIVVNMPVQAEYEAMVPTPLKSRWPSETIKAANQYGFEVVDLNDPTVFTPDHFLDMSHLNRKGSLKVNELLSREIARRKLVDGL